MATSKISWLQGDDGSAGKVWNPVTGCTPCASGCQHCYAAAMARRQMGPWKGRKFSEVRCHDDRLEQPLHWKKSARIFVDSMGDLFHDKVPFEFVKRVWDIIAKASWHTFIILTKRPQRMLEFHRWLAGDDDISIASWPRNAQVGVSVSTQADADKLIPPLLDCPASVRFVS
jgi:protein gp37